MICSDMATGRADNAQSSLDVEFILRNVENLCLKLIELGEEYFLVTANPKRRGSSKQIGSNQGRQFLSQQSDFIYKFMNYCYEASSRADDKKSLLLQASGNDNNSDSTQALNSFFSHQEKQENPSEKEATHEARRGDNSIVYKTPCANALCLNQTDACTLSARRSGNQLNSNIKDRTGNQLNQGERDRTCLQKENTASLYNDSSGIIDNDINVNFDSDNDELSQIMGMIVQNTVSSFDNSFKDQLPQKLANRRNVENEVDENEEKEETSQQEDDSSVDTIIEDTSEIELAGIKSKNYPNNEMINKTRTSTKGDNSVLDIDNVQRITRSKLRDEKDSDDSQLIKNKKGKVFKCDLCGKVFTKKFRLIRHEKSHTVKKEQKAENVAESFKCVVCNLKFKNLSNLQRHEKRHSTERNFLCGNCGKKFYRSDALKKHAMCHCKPQEDPVKEEVTSTNENIDNIHQCDTCDEILSSRRSLLRHKNKHTGLKNYTCKVCNKSYSRQDVYRHHIKTHQSQTVKCDICQKSFLSQQKLDQHVEKNHDDSKNEYECGQCHQRYKWEYLLSFHNCNKSYKENMTLYYQHMQKDHVEKSEDIGQLECPVCKKTFKQKRSMISHWKSHQEATKYKCSVCSQLFKQRCNLNKHLRFVHSTEKNFVCDICGKSFKQGDTLKQHRKLHTDGPPTQYQCETCGKYLSGSSALEIHMRSHSGVKPFMCEICGRSFRQSGNMQKHMLVHTDKTTYKCEICQKEYKYQETWKAHMRSHVLREGKVQGNASAYGKFYTCQYCDKKMSSASQYKVHLRTHTNERPYKCHVCEKAFKEHGKLSRHLKIHDSEFQVNTKRLKLDKKLPDVEPQPEGQLMALTSAQPIETTHHQYMGIPQQESQIPQNHLASHMGPHPVLLLASEYHQQQQQQHMQPQHPSPHPQEELVPITSHDQFYRDIKSMMFPNSSL